MLKCLPSATTQGPVTSLQAEHLDCKGVAAVHYGGVGSGNACTSVSSTMQSSGVSASVLLSLQTADIFNICCEFLATFAYNAEFYCHIKRCPALK